MMIPRKLPLALLCALVLLPVGVAHAQVITLAHNYTKPPRPETPDTPSQPVEIRTGQTAEIICQSGGGILYFKKPGDETKYSIAPGHYVTGPVVIHFDRENYVAAMESAWATIRVQSQTFPPGKTMILGEGTNTAAITLECSTNLVHWSTCTNGFYGGSNNAVFFRINGTVINTP